MRGTTHLVHWIATIAAASVYSFPALPQSCGFQKAFERPDEKGTQLVNVYESSNTAGVGRVLAFVTKLKVNTDGTRISYNAIDPRAQRLAINDIRNAYSNPSRPISDLERIRDAHWRPSSRVWEVLDPKIIERDTRPGHEGPCIDSAGYLTSMTADVAVTGGFARAGDCDQSKWIDALTVPAIVLPRKTRRIPSQFASKGALTRSVALVRTLGAHSRTIPGIVGDLGPATEIGEASVEMNRMLNGLPDGAVPTTARDAINRFQAGRSIVLVFPGEANRLSRPITPERTKDFAERRFAAWGGEARLDSCLSEIPEAN